MSAAPSSAVDQGIGPGPDGETIVDASYYELLGVKGNADDNTIKKAYRKQAMKYHPDKNPGDESAAAKFQEISEAYAILSDSNARAVYNKHGKKSAIDGAGGEEAMPDPGQIFSQMFGGKAFEDWVGEISLGKDVSKAFEMSTTEEERAELKAELSDKPPTTVGASATPSVTPTVAPTAEAEKPTMPAAAPESHVATPAGDVNHPELIPASAHATESPEHGVGASTSHADATMTKEEKRRLAAEQREKMDQYERERAEEKRERVRVLTQKLRDRVRPFVEATNPGAEGDPETQRFAERIKEESQDLAMESFGVEICQLIGTIYMSKANSYMKLHKKSGNILGVAGWWSRVKEKGAMIKEGWSFLSHAEDEMKQLETDLSGKMLLVAWKGSKFELSSVLRQVVEGALTKESPTVTDEMLMNRAKAIFLVGAILKSVKPSQEDDERRELERMVEEANRKRKESKSSKKKK